jgi:hypothetical protein
MRNLNFISNFVFQKSTQLISARTPSLVLRAGKLENEISTKAFQIRFNHRNLKYRSRTKARKLKQSSGKSAQGSSASKLYIYLKCHGKRRWENLIYDMIYALIPPAHFVFVLLFDLHTWFSFLGFSPPRRRP